MIMMMLLTTIHSYHLLRTYHGSFIILEALPKFSHLNLSPTKIAPTVPFLYMRDQRF